MNSYDKGDLVRCTAAFTDAAGSAFDPDTVAFKSRNPVGSVTTYTYGVDAELVKDSTGNYHVDVDANRVGTWTVRFESTGTGQAAAESQFRIVESEFD